MWIISDAHKYPGLDSKILQGTDTKGNVTRSRFSHVNVPDNWVWNMKRGKWVPPGSLAPFDNCTIDDYLKSALPLMASCSQRIAKR